MMYEIPELLIQDNQNIINCCFTDITICMLHWHIHRYTSKGTKNNAPLNKRNSLLAMYIRGHQNYIPKM